MTYIISSQKQLENHPIYVVDTDFGSQIFYNYLCFEEEKQKQIEDQVQVEKFQVAEDNGI